MGAQPRFGLVANRRLVGMVDAARKLCRFLYMARLQGLFWTIWPRCSAPLPFDLPCLSVLLPLLPSPAPAEQRVAQLVLDDPAAFARLPVRTFGGIGAGEQADGGALCRSMGYDGLSI